MSAWSVPRSSRLDGVEGIADRPIPDGVEVTLEAMAIESCDDMGELLRVDEVDPPVVRRPPPLVEIGLKHRCSEVLHHTVEHELHRGRAKAGRRLFPAFQQLLDLFQPPGPIPPQRPDHSAF